jgi:hypothetical protein
MAILRKNPLIFEDVEDNGFMNPFDEVINDEEARRLAEAYRAGDTDVIDAVIKGESAVQNAVETPRSLTDNTPAGFSQVGVNFIEPTNITTLSNVTGGKNAVLEDVAREDTQTTSSPLSTQTVASTSAIGDPLAGLNNYGLSPLNLDLNKPFKLPYNPVLSPPTTPEEQTQFDEYWAANPIDLGPNFMRNTFAKGFDLNGGGLRLNSPEEQIRLNELDKIIDPLTQQILDQGTTAHWTGEGHGSAQANARDMATLLASAGITDITQFGKVDKYSTAEAIGHTLNGKSVQNPSPGVYYEMVYEGESENGPQYRRRDLTPQEAAQVKTTYGKPDGSDSDGNIVYSALSDSDIVMRNGVPTYVSGKTFGNIETGQAIKEQFSRQRGEDVFGGTSEGSGNTGYRVDFSNGIPLFYTTYGSSNDLVNLFADNPLLGKIANAAAAYFGGPWAVAALQAAQGKSIKEIATSAVLTYAGGQVAQGISGSEGLVNSVGQNTANVVARAAGQTISSGGRINIVDALVGGGLEAGTSEVLKNVDGFQDLSTGQKTFVTNVVKTTIQNGGSLSVDQLADAALTAGRAALDESKTGVNAVAIKADETINNAVNEAINNTATTDSTTETPATSVFANREITSSITEPELNATITTSPLELPKIPVDPLEEIKSIPKFNDAYAAARRLLGAGKVFEWDGKKYSTDTAAENPALANASIEAISARNLATPTDASRTVAAQNDTLARNATNESSAETSRLTRQNTALSATENTGFFSNLVGAVQNQMKLSSDAANDYLRNNPDSPITNSVSTAMEAAGNLQKNVAGGVSLLLDNKPLADAFVKSGNDLASFGQSIGRGVVDTKNWNETMGLLEKATGWEKLGVMAGRIMDGTSGLGRQVEVELRQELPGLFLGGGSVKGILLATGAMDVAETTGNAALDAYDDAVKKGSTHADALADARTAGAAAGLTEAAIQLTLGKVADAVVGKVSNVAGKAGAKVLGEGVVEGGQEGGSSLAVNAVLGQELDVNKALTQAVAGAAVGKGTAATTSPTDIATSETINNNISTAINTGDAAGVNTAITNSVQQSLSNGSSVEVAVGSSVNSAITNGNDADASITAAVSSAITNDANVAQTVTASIDSAITAGSDTSIAINSTVSSAISSGADVSQTVSSSITAATAAGVSVDNAITNTVNSAVTASISSGADVATSVNTAVSSAITSAVTGQADVTTAVSSSVSSSITAAASSNANVTAAVDSAVTSAITTAVSNNVNASTAVTTAVDSAVTTAIDNNVNATTAITTSVTAAINASVSTNANVNTSVNTAVDAAVNAAVNAGVDTNTAVNAAVDAVIDANVNTNININIDAITNTATQTAKTAEEKVDLVKTVNDLISGTTATTPTAPTKPTKSKKKTDEAVAGMGGFTFSGSGVIDPLKESFLKTYMTKDSFKDPLEKLREMQGAEQPADNQMMQQQIDPYLASILAERNATQSEPEPEAPQSPPLWSFGQEPDSIDAMLAPKAPVEPVPEKAFKSGGFVAPLQMASGGSSSGSMALPLLAKSGGALGALQRPDGRMDFRHGAHVAGDGDGQSDDIKAMLADGEFVFPADVVSALGNGSTKAGSDKLYEMMHAIRDRARSTGTKDLPPPALKSPLDYLKKGSKK